MGSSPARQQRSERLPDHAPGRARPSSSPASTSGTRAGVASARMSATGPLLGDGARERSRTHRGLGRDDPDATGPCRRGRCHRAGPHDAQDGHVAAPTESCQGDRRRRAAGDHDGLDVLGDEVVEALPAERDDLLVRPRPVRRPRVVPEVDGALARQPATHLPQHGQPTDTGVEQPDGPRVAHGDLTVCEPGLIPATPLTGPQPHLRWVPGGRSMPPRCASRPRSRGLAARPARTARPGCWRPPPGGHRWAA